MVHSQKGMTHHTKCKNQMCYFPNMSEPLHTRRPAGCLLVRNEKSKGKRTGSAIIKTDNMPKYKHIS